MEIKVGDWVRIGTNSNILGYHEYPMKVIGLSKNEYCDDVLVVDFQEIAIWSENGLNNEISPRFVYKDVEYIKYINRMNKVGRLIGE